MDQAQQIVSKFLTENDAPLAVIEAWNEVLLSSETRNAALEFVSRTVKDALEAVTYEPELVQHPAMAVNPFHLEAYIPPAVEIMRLEKDSVQATLEQMNADGFNYYWLKKRDARQIWYLECTDKLFLRELVMRLFVVAETNEMASLAARRIAKWAGFKELLPAA